MMYEEYDSFIDKTGIFNNQNKTLDNIQKDIEELVMGEEEEEIKKLLKWDLELLLCCEIPLEKRSEGQQFLFPQLTLVNGMKIPDIDNFDQERFGFYKHRSEIITNVNSKLRYANYCFQYCDKKQKYKHAMEICQLLCGHLNNIVLGYEYVVGFSRLFELSLSYSSTDIMQKLDGIVEEIISREYSHAEYLWILSISRIVTNNILRNKKKLISEKTQKKFVDIMDGICNYYFTNVDYCLYRNCCANYMDWLKILNQQEEISEVMLKIGESYELDAEKKGNTNLIKAEFYQMAAWHYANIGERKKVYNLKVKIKSTFKNAASSNEYKTISTTQSIPVKQLEEETKEFFKDSIDATLAAVSYSNAFIINIEKIALQAAKQAENPLYKLIDFGRIEGNRKVFSTQNDDDLVKLLLFQHYEIELEVTFSTIVNFIWNKMIDKGLTAQMVRERILESEYMNDTQSELISVGIDRFFAEDYVSALHILVPQFESYFRTFFEWGGFPTTSLKNNGIQYEQNFNDFLRQEFVRKVLDKNLLFMIEFVMVEQLGKNLRNNIAHGLSDINTFRKNNCLIVIYLFWKITSIKWKFEPDKNKLKYNIDFEH